MDNKLEVGSFTDVTIGNITLKNVKVEAIDPKNKKRVTISHPKLSKPITWIVGSGKNLQFENHEYK